MAWVYQQGTGRLYRNGRLVATGYAGKGNGKNNPEMQNVQMVGPLPRGTYSITGAPFRHPTTGIYSIRLEPNSGNAMHGRSGFLIHGDSRQRPGDASNGCIILPRNIRETIWNSGDRQVEVTR